jgi:uncharacterized membrane protein
MGALDRLSYKGLPDHVQAELRAQRAEFWRAVAQTAVGVFVALCAFALVLYVALKIWVDSVFD